MLYNDFGVFKSFQNPLFYIILYKKVPLVVVVVDYYYIIYIYTLFYIIKFEECNRFSQENLLNCKLQKHLREKLKQFVRLQQIVKE